ncbi:MAG TPA: hypothetical protein PKM44_15555 [Turneriella sp.]|nr:hypothetical protein [Turneriella sp.]HNL11926.1 hypothetical protein [Turneriella sp.]
MRCPECGTVYDEDGDNTVCCPACGDFGMFSRDDDEADYDDRPGDPPYTDESDDTSQDVSRKTLRAGHRLEVEIVQLQTGTRCVRLNRYRADGSVLLSLDLDADEVGALLQILPELAEDIHQAQRKSDIPEKDMPF